MQKLALVLFYGQRDEENRVFGMKSSYLQQTIVCHRKFVMWYVEPFNVETVYLFVRLYPASNSGCYDFDRWTVQ